MNTQVEQTAAPTFTQADNHPLVRLADLAGRAVRSYGDNAVAQMLFGFIVYLSLTLFCVFTAAGQALSTDLLAVLFSIWNLFADQIGLARVDFFTT
ncbi:hypothetical protein [Acetobacter senegalensis]|uniref:hypothetical protein n=1 Tax=Acetobacter senegalensis TaxID=446692 RepID=UPI002651C4DC|nr:hypothetical protein [Acetobacter senegalensis]MDN7356352.1 hypothetical protein [Acetobacter senegalensis]